MDRQKLLLIFGGAWVSAALLTWILYSATTAPKADKTVKAVAAARDMPAGTRLKKTDIKDVKVVERDLPRSAVLDENNVVGRVLLFPVNTSEVITVSRLASVSGAEGLPATIEPGKRAISVPFTDATGVAGLIQPRSHVDVLFTRPGSLAEAVTTTVLEDVIVLAIGRNTEVTPAVPVTPGSTTPTANISTTTQRAATLLVTPEQARKLEWAKNQGKISLALRNPLDRQVSAETEPTTAFDLNLTGIRPRRGLPPSVGDRRVWAQLTGQPYEEPQAKKPAPVVEKPKPEPPPKPRFVVDVYRGDKHVQEIFQ
jgi:pilus assembly protein CpaB